MPIYEYSCDDCGSKFEQLVRRTEDADQVRCPSCGQHHLTAQYSTFAAHASKSTPAASPCGSGPCGSGMCGADFCGGGMCGMSSN